MMLFMWYIMHLKNFFKIFLDRINEMCYIRKNSKESYKKEIVIDHILCS